MPENYKTQTAKAFNENIKSGNYIGAVMRSLPAVNEVIQKPLFDVYIPRLKVGNFFEEFPHILDVNAKQLANGTVTRAQLARQTWDRIENRFGEMNFDNLYWNKTFKSSMQLLFRSVTWKLGNVRGFGSAITGQAKEFTEPLKFIASKVTGKQIGGGGRMARLDPSMAWVLGMCVTTATLSSIIQYTRTGKYPSELKDYVFPKTGEKDKNGNDIRLSVPTYMKDALALTKNPKSYVASSLSGIISKSLDAMNNRDYFGNFVYDPKDPVFQKAIDIFKYTTPMPFSVSTIKNLNESGATTDIKALSLLGFPKASKEFTLSEFQKELQKSYTSQRGPSKPLTPDEQLSQGEKRDLKQRIYNGEATPSEIQDAVNQGLIRKDQVKNFEKTAKLNTVQTMWKYLTLAERQRLIDMGIATPEEIDMIRKIEATRKKGNAVTFK